MLTINLLLAKLTRVSSLDEGYIPWTGYVTGYETILDAGNTSITALLSSTYNLESIFSEFSYTNPSNTFSFNSTMYFSHVACDSSTTLGDITLPLSPLDASQWGVIPAGSGYGTGVIDLADAGVTAGSLFEVVMEHNPCAYSGIASGSIWKVAGTPAGNTPTIQSLTIQDSQFTMQADSFLDNGTALLWAGEVTGKTVLFDLGQSGDTTILTAISFAAQLQCNIIIVPLTAF
jgi:hypothetical protein